MSGGRSKKMYEYTPRGTCSTKIRFEIRDRRVRDLSFQGGCDGNLKALGRLLEGMEAGEIIRKLRGVQCGNRGTSCADQLAQALEKHLREAGEPGPA
jgi:uncharacterized protein (TIGR03905 family)